MSLHPRARSLRCRWSAPECVAGWKIRIASDFQAPEQTTRALPAAGGMLIAKLGPRAFGHRVCSDGMCREVSVSKLRFDG